MDWEQIADEIVTINRPDSIGISQEDLSELRKMAGLIEQYEIVLSSLKHRFDEVIAERYKIDLVNEKWELDLDNGYIRRQG